MILALFEHPDGVRTTPGARVVYDLDGGRAHLGAAVVPGPALVWEIDPSEALVTARRKDVPALMVGVDIAGRERAGEEWIVRCDRVDFPPGTVAYRHDHAGPGIRRLLCGELTIESDEGTHTYGAGQAWFEDAGSPVVATASATEATAFVRVLLLPPEWAGRRTIRYLDPADEEKPRRQRASVLLEEPLAQ